MCVGFSTDKIVIFAKKNFEFCSQRSALVHNVTSSSPGAM